MCTVSAVVDFDVLTWFTASQSSSNPSTTVLRGCLVLPCNSLPRCLQGRSLPIVFHHFRLFLQACQSTSFAADRRQGCGAFRMIATNCFCMPSSRFLPSDPCSNTRCSWHAKCAFRACLRKTGQVRQQLLTIGPTGRFCASQAPQLCLAAARMNLHLAPPRRITRASVRFDGCPCSRRSSKFVFVSAMSRMRTVLFHIPGHLLALCFL